MVTNYNIDFKRIVTLFLPSCLRSQSVKAFAWAMFYAWEKKIIPDFEKNREENFFKLRHNGQVVFLRKALNESFKSHLNGVYFDVFDLSEELQWIYAQGEESFENHTFAWAEKNNDVNVFATDENRMDSKNTFVIYVPADLYEKNILQIKQFVNQYRLVTRVPKYQSIN